MDKKAARAVYYEAIRQAAVEQFKVTEKGLRNLEGLDASKIEKLVPIQSLGDSRSSRA